MEMISIQEAYEKAVAAIPGAAVSQAWELCRQEMRRNLAVAFGGETEDLKVYTTVGKSSEFRVDMMGRVKKTEPLPTSSTT